MKPMPAPGGRRPGAHPSYVSSCTLDGVAVTVWTDVDELIPRMTPWAQPAARPASPPGKHPLTIEVWRVRDGRWESPSGDQHAWAERAGRWTGAILGGGLGTWGAAARPPESGWSDALGWLELGADAVAGGAALGAGRFGDLFRRWSHAAAASGGTYNEILVTTPARLQTGRSQDIFAFVLAMYTDSPIALWGDLALRCGYRKRLARFDRPAPRRCRVLSLTGEELSSIDWSDDISNAASFPARLIDERAALPLLGGQDQNRWAVSLLERSFANGPSAAPVRASISLAGGLIDGLPALNARVPALSRRNRWGAFRFDAVPARLTYPRHDVA